MKVIATQRGFYDRKVREIGEAFSLSDSSHFSRVWMESPKAPEALDDGTADAQQPGNPVRKVGRPRKEQ